MQHRVVLNVAMVADDDAIDVTPQHRAIPDAAVRAQRHVADHGGGLGDKNFFAQLRLAAEKGVELRIKFGHAKSLRETPFSNHEIRARKSA